MLIGIFFYSSRDWAYLGGPASTAQSDCISLKGELTVNEANTVYVCTVNTPPKLVVSETLNSARMVQKVVWRGPRVPNLFALSGVYGADLKSLPATNGTFSTSNITINRMNTSGYLLIKNPVKNTKNLFYFGQHMHRLVDPKSPIQGQTLFPSPQTNGAMIVGTLRTWDSGTGTWAIVEPSKGNFDFSRLDLFVNKAFMQGADIVHTLGSGTPTWASARPKELFVYGLGGAAEPLNNSDFKDYVDAVFTHYKGKIKYYELWNEPEFYGPPPAGQMAGFYSGTAEKLFELQQIAFEELRQIDPSAKLLSPGFVGFDNLNIYLTAAGSSFTNFCDGINYHFYSNNPEEIITIAKQIRMTLKNHAIASLPTSGGLPIMNSESGFLTPNSQPIFGPPQVSTENFPGWVARSFIWGIYENLSKFIYYSYDGYSGTKAFSNPVSGVLNSGGMAQATVANWLTGATLGDCYFMGNKVISCDVFRNILSTISTARLVWKTDDLISTFSFPSSWGVQLEAETLNGIRIDLTEQENIKISGSPILIKSIKDPWNYDSRQPIARYIASVNSCENLSESYASQVITSLPVAYYKMSSLANSVLLDESGYHNNARLVIPNSRPKAVAGALAPKLNAPLHKALSFNPSGTLNGVSTLAGPVSLNPWSNDFTIEFWAKQDDFSSHGGEQVAFGSGDYLSTGFRLGPIGDSSSGSWVFWTSESGGGKDGFDLRTKIPLNIGTWYHISFTYTRDTNTARLYVNGLLDSESSQGIYNSSTGGITIGGGYSWGFYGAIDEVAFYDKALSADILRAHYQSGSNYCGYLKIIK